MSIKIKYLFGTVYKASEAEVNSNYGPRRSPCIPAGAVSFDADSSLEGSAAGPSTRTASITQASSIPTTDAGQLNQSLTFQATAGDKATSFGV